ncbi:hypothetical protein [Brevibacillus reuszeri]|uniref:hypothetical protein n=1 Tax=Brevibacillus reuszeri TaxID=54915 RepID=UPI000CCC2FB4|nr:hypothetical protein [Brevibacillus reuszeri]
MLSFAIWGENGLVETVLNALLAHIEVEQKKYRIWAFLNQHSRNKYYSGYSQALEDLQSKIKNELKTNTGQLVMEFNELSIEAGNVERGTVLCLSEQISG